MADQTIGTVYVQVEPSGRGFGKKIEGDISPDIDAVGRKGSSSLLSKIGGAFGTIGKIGHGAITTITGGIVGLAAKGGFERALNIENAQAKLKGLGHDAGSVKEIMGDALAAVKGTSFGMGDAATVAATLSASGVAQGSQLTNVLKTVADTAQISGRSLTDIGTIFSSVAARGKLQGDDMLQLMSSGVPVLQLLGKHLGKTSAEVSDMVSKGQIDFNTFAQAMQEGLGGAALSAGDTFSGALANVKAALSRLGETVATPVLNGLRQLFNQAIPLIDGFASSAQPILASVGKGLGDGIAKVIPTMQSFFQQVSGNQAFASLATAIGHVAGNIVDLGLQIGAALAPQIRSLWDRIPGLAGVFANLLNAISELIDFVAANADWLVPLSEGVFGFIAASKGISLVGNGFKGLIKGIGAITGTFNKIASGAKNVSAAIDLITELDEPIQALKDFAGGLKIVSAAQEAWSAATKAAQAVQIAFSAIMATTWGPWAAGIAVITAVVGALTYFFTQTETGKQLWSDFTGWLSTTWQTISTTAQTVFTTLGGFFAGLWDSISGTATAAWTTISAILTPVISGMATFIEDVFIVLAAVLVTIWNGINGVVMTAWTAISGFISGTLTAIQGVWNTVWTAIAAFVAPIWAGISGAISSAFGAVSGFISGTLAAIQGVWNSIWSAISGFVGPIWTAISGTVGGAISAVGSAISAALGWISGVWSSAWNGMVGAANGAVNAIRGVIGSIWGVVTGALSGAGNWLYGIGRNIISGLIGGIQGAFGWLRDIIGQMGHNVLDWAKEVLHIHSPSRLMRDKVGVMIGRGVAVGIDDSQDEVRSAVENMATAVDLSGYTFVTPKSVPPQIPMADLRKSFMQDQNISADTKYGINTENSTTRDMATANALLRELQAIHEDLPLIMQQLGIQVDGREFGRVVDRYAHA